MDAEKYTFRHVRNSLRSYVEGKKNNIWAIGIISKSGINKEKLNEIFVYLKSYIKSPEENDRLKELLETYHKLNT